MSSQKKSQERMEKFLAVPNHQNFFSFFQCNFSCLVVLSVLVVGPIQGSANQLSSFLLRLSPAVWQPPWFSHFPETAPLVPQMEGRSRAPHPTQGNPLSCGFPEPPSGEKVGGTRSVCQHLTQQTHRYWFGFLSKKTARLATIRNESKEKQGPSLKGTLPCSLDFQNYFVAILKVLFFNNIFIL